MALMIVVFIASYIVIAPIKSKFREIVWYSGQEFSLGERSALIYDLYKDYQFDKDIQTQESIDRSNFFWRYSYQASALSLVIENTPSRIPYWEGESYTILSKFIPRFFWPDKPEENMGYKFGTRYGILSQYNFSTSMNTPMVTEMYMNFGYYGIVIGMILLAIVNIYLNNYFNQNTISDIGKVYAVAMIFPFIAHESNFSLTYGNIPLIVITVYLLMRFYLRVEK